MIYYLKHKLSETVVLVIEDKQKTSQQARF